MRSHTDARTDRPGEFRCGYTGEVFPYPYDGAGDNRRAAERELNRHQTDYREAAEARAGRKLTSRELVRGGAQPADMRSRSEKIATDSYIKVSTHDPDANALAPRLAELKAELAALPSHGYKVSEKRAALERRIHAIAPQTAAREAELTAKREREAILSQPDVQTALADAQASVVLIQCKRDVPQEWVDGARKRKADLESSGDHAAYWRETRAAEAKQAEAIEGKAAAIDAEAAKLRADASAVRREANDEGGAAE